MTICPLFPRHILFLGLRRKIHLAGDFLNSQKMYRIQLLLSSVTIHCVSAPLHDPTSSNLFYFRNQNITLHKARPQMTKMRSQGNIFRRSYWGHKVSIQVMSVDCVTWAPDLICWGTLFGRKRPKPVHVESHVIVPIPLDWNNNIIDHLSVCVPLV